MPMNVRIAGEGTGRVAVLSNFGRLFNDPRYIDAARDLRALIDDGLRRFVVDMSNLRELSDTSLGLLTTLTRQVRRADGEIVLAHITREVGTYLDEMRMDDYWDVFDTVDAAVHGFPGAAARDDAEDEDDA